jgi:hypothetical protein
MLGPRPAYGAGVGSPVVPDVEKMALNTSVIFGSRQSMPPYGSRRRSRNARIASLSMNGTFSWKSSMDWMSSAVMPAASHVSRISAERWQAHGSRSPSSRSSRRRSISSRDIVSISGEK